uniref:Uncharacterized protein n=1 Tax=Strombidium rassoulzadegani TaxID=1082188 RepID=A0A7S3CPG1_9SPIT|mmetsp:Transcript_17810/g.30187  ORF Transcript_17810/g.30187 Transcript_17810/m.30187 type:complete len:163 (+) Transcript_17810:426-914(+)
MDAFKTLGGYGNVSSFSQSQELMRDIEMLQEIVGEDIIDYEELKVLESASPGIIILLVQKVWNLLRYLARVPITTENGEVTEMNVYKRALDSLVLQFTKEDGTVPGWIQTIEAVYMFGQSFHKVIEKVENGELASITDLYPGEMFLLSLVGLDEVPLSMVAL